MADESAAWTWNDVLARLREALGELFQRTRSSVA